jgi:hypothetical protein
LSDRALQDALEHIADAEDIRVLEAIAREGSDG